METARQAQAALNRHLDQPRQSARWKINGRPLTQLADLSQLLPAPEASYKVTSGAAALTPKNSAWTFWSDKSFREIKNGDTTWNFSGGQKLWLAGAERTEGRHRWGLAVGTEQLKLTTDWAGPAHDRVRQELVVALPYWEYQMNPDWQLRGMLGYGTGKIKFTEQAQSFQAARAWQLAGLETRYQPQTQEAFDKRLALGINITRSTTGNFTSTHHAPIALGKSWAYEFHGSWESGYQLTVGHANHFRPFWAAAARTQWGTQAEALILHGGLGADWELPVPALTGRFYWERQLTENALVVKNNFTLGLKKQFTPNKYLNWQGQGKHGTSWTQEVRFRHETRWRKNTLIKEFNFNNEYTVGGKLIIKFK